jgi:hypothetical protein
MCLTENVSRGMILCVDGFLFSDKEKVSEAVGSIVEGASTPGRNERAPTDPPT